jgi:uncharacterized protein
MAYVEIQAQVDIMAQAALQTLPIDADGETFYQMGLIHAVGRGQPVDKVAAHKWFNVALARGFRPAAEARAELACEMAADEVALALREARAFLTIH